MTKAKPHPDCAVCRKKARAIKAAQREGRCGRRPSIPDADVLRYVQNRRAGQTGDVAAGHAGHPESSLRAAAKRLGFLP